MQVGMQVGMQLEQEGGVTQHTLLAERSEAIGRAERGPSGTRRSGARPSEV